MPEKSIKSGSEVVSEFIDSLETMEGVDEYTKDIIKSLHSTGFTHTKLIQELTRKRQELLENDKD
ncbi:MAG: hypothetical protein RX316_05860 [bacterium]|nr:hypothetical protein [bacterium]